MKVARTLSDDDLRDDCAKVVSRLFSFGAKIQVVPTEADEWWRFDAPAPVLKACRFELAMAAFFAGRGCGVHAKRGRHGFQFGSKRLNGAFCRAVHEAGR